MIFPQCGRPPNGSNSASISADIIGTAARSRAQLNLDLKTSGIERQLIDLVRATGLTGRVTCTGGNWALLAGIHRAEPGIDAGLTMPRRLLPWALQPAQRLWYAWRAPGILAAYDAQVVSCHRELVSGLLVRRLHAAGKQIWVWTVDRPSEIVRLRELGVDGICSDDPASHGWGEKL